MRTMCSQEIFTKKCQHQGLEHFDSDLKGAWHYNHVTFTPIAKNFMLLPTSEAFWKTRRPDEAADYRAARRYVYPKKISETLKSVE